MLSEQEILVQMETLSERYGERHQMFEGLRRFWHGHIWQDSDQMAKSLASVFRDLRHGAGGDREPDIKVTLPLIEAVVEKFMGYLTSVPQISVLTPPIGYAGLRKEETCRALADQNERFFYGVWEQNNVRHHFAEQSWYLPLMGSCFIGVHPDFKGKTVKFLNRSPENAFPIWDEEGQYLEAIGFQWEVPMDTAIRRFGSEVAELGQNAGQGGLPWRRRTRRDTLQITEWYDENSKTTLVAGHKVQGVEHKLGFCPWVHVPFYHVPDEPFGKGVIEGNIGLFHKLNMLDSLELQAVIENVFARLVIVNPAVAPEDIDDGPGGVIPVGLGGDVKWIGPPDVTTDLTKAMARSMDTLQRGTHLPGSAFGEGVASSITTGKAQHESMLPTGSIIEYVQGNIGDAWTRINEMSADIVQQVFANREVTYYGRQYSQTGFLAAMEKPKRFQQTMKGKEIKDWTRHELTFSPHMNEHEKVVMNLQLAGGGIVSKRFIMDSVGIVDSSAMKNEILSEMMTEQKLAAMVQMIAGGAMTPEQVETSFYALDKGATDPNAAISGMGTPAMPAPGLPMPPGAPPGAPPGGPMGGPPPAPSELPGAVNPGDAPAGGAPVMPGAPPPAGRPQFEFTLEGAIGDFATIKKLKGEVYLVGEIVARGGTNDRIEVAVTDKLDKTTIINGLPDEYAGKLRFRVIDKTPEEPFVQVGPAHKQGTFGGGAGPDHPDAVTSQEHPDGLTPLQDQGALPSFQPPLAANFPAGGFQGSLRS